MKILVGTSGIPDSAKNLPTIEAPRVISQIGLQAMEIAFVRQVYLTNAQAEQLGKVASESNVQLSIHAPYYINLASEEKSILSASKKRILDSVERGEHMKAKIIAIHAGYYGKFTHDQAFDEIKKSLTDILKTMRARGWENVLLGLETTGKEKQWGTLEEILRMCGEVKGCHPYIDFAHLFVKGNGKIDYGKILDELTKSGYRNLYGHFEGVEKKNGKFVDVHDRVGDNPPFKPLARELIKRKLDTNLVCESSAPESDALKMKKICEELGYTF